MDMVLGPLTAAEAASRCNYLVSELCPGPMAAIDEGDKIRTIYDGSWGRANAHIQSNCAERTTAPTVMDCMHGIHWLQATQTEPSEVYLPMLTGIGLPNKRNGCCLRQMLPRLIGGSRYSLRSGNTRWPAWEMNGGSTRLAPMEWRVPKFTGAAWQPCYFAWFITPFPLQTGGLSLWMTSAGSSGKPWRNLSLRPSYSFWWRWVALSVGRRQRLDLLILGWASW